MAVRLEAFVATRHVPRVYALLAPVAALAEHGITLAIRTIVAAHISQRVTDAG